jgi:beta-lactamase regulating signal transducer with metallopeptidase domain
MNTLIEALNAWADHALRFAWPMLWQSSLLVGLLFALDLLLRRKVRPAVRYAMWLVVLLKLLLPPSLAFPTSPGWWLRPAKTATATPRQASVVVTYGAPQDSPLPTAVTPVFVEPPRPHLSSVAWLLLGVVTVSLGLLAWMLARWHQVARDARRAAAAPSWVNELLHELPWSVQPGRACSVEVRTKEPQRRDEHREIGAEDSAQTNHLSCSDLQVAETCLPLRPSRLCGSEGRSSTAPLRLRLTDHPQSPAVCGLFRPVILLPRSLAERLPPAQLRAVLLHELLHLRRGDVWVNFVQALLQIAYWWHPLLWLANARIRRVREEAVDDAVMLALNEDAETYAPTLLEVAKLALHRPLASLGLVGILESRSSLRQRIERLMDFRPPHKAGLTLASALAVLGFAALAVPMGEAPATNEVPQSAASQTATNHSASNGPSSASSLDQSNVRTNWIRTIDKRQAILRKFNSIRLDRVSFDGLPLSEVVRRLTEETRKRDPEKLGVNFTVRPVEPAKAPSEASLEPLTGLPKPAQLDPSSIAITTKPPLTNARLADVLDAIVKGASQPIKYYIETNGVAFAARTGQEPPPLYVRSFKVDPNTLLDNLHVARGSVGTNKLDAIVSAALRDYFTSAGVDLDPVRNVGKALFYEDRQGRLVVRATLQDINIIEQKLVPLLPAASSQVNLKARFIEMPEDVAREVWGKPYLTNWVGTEARVAVLSKPQAAVLLKQLQALDTTSLLAQPEVTTASGRQALCKATDIKTVLKGIDERALTPPGITTTNGDESSVYVTEPCEIGSQLDVTQSVLDDGYTIAIKVVPTVFEFLGYEEDRTNRVAVYVNGKQKWISRPRPKLQAREMRTDARVWDGQTLMLGNPELRVGNWEDVQVMPAEKPGDGKRRLVVLVTPTIITPEGNLLHSEEDMPFARDAVPPQAPH